MSTPTHTAEQFPTPRVGLSQCLELEACRHDGARLSDPFVARLMDFVEVVPTCPEVGIGLGVPRPTLRLVARGEDARHLLQPETGRDLTESMERFSADFLDRAPALDGFLLKSRSPSCGPGDVRVYAAVADAPVVRKDSGLFAEAVLARLGDLPVEDEGRLRSFPIRHHFLMRLFAAAALRRLGEDPDMGALVRFHARYKLLLLVHDQEGMRALGRVAANHDGLPADEVHAAYAAGFHRAMARPARKGAHVNALQHAFGHFSEDLAAAEKRQFLALLDQYRDSRVPLAAPLTLLHSWCERFDYDYLRDQAYLEPYPLELVEMRDSGKGVDS